MKNFFATVLLFLGCLAIVAGYLDRQPIVLIVSFSFLYCAVRVMDFEE